ncbi:MAG: ribbon-helix-helix protein, CopG family [Blastocatellia bacterium]|nr:ribbon-helix-helix protein, CopG family [Blastocatellia bacterium]
MQESTDVISVRVPSKTHKKLADIAEDIDRSQNWVINQAIESYLEVYEWQKEEVKKAIAEANAGGKFYSSDEIDKVVESFRR